MSRGAGYTAPAWDCGSQEQPGDPAECVVVLKLEEGTPCLLGLQHRCGTVPQEREGVWFLLRGARAQLARQSHS